MAIRPIFLPTNEQSHLVEEKHIEFKWHSGYAQSQAQKSIRSLHEEAEKLQVYPILDISSKSPSELGVSLSAFNLMMEENGRFLSVECAYQGSKFFENGGPYEDIYNATSKEAKKDKRLETSGSFSGYKFFGTVFPDKPVTAFYNWLYLKALYQNPRLSNQIFDFKGFSDIAFTPNKSINCQARAAALFVSLSNLGELKRVVEDKCYYVKLIESQNKNRDDLIIASSNELEYPKVEKRLSKNTINTQTSRPNPKSEEKNLNTIVFKERLPLDFDVFTNYFILKIPEALATERSQDEISKLFGISKKMTSDWLKKAEEMGQVKKLRRPIRYIATSYVPHEQLSVNLEP